MAEKKKAYQRFGDLTRKATAPGAVEATDDTTPVEPAQAQSLTVQLTPELQRALARRAAADDKTPTEIVEEALRRYLKTWN